MAELRRQAACSGDTLPVELFGDEAARLELAAEAEPWLLARALETSSVGKAALEALEETVGEIARSYPSTARRGAAGGGRRPPGRAGPQPALDLRDEGKPPVTLPRYAT